MHNTVLPLQVLFGVLIRTLWQILLVHVFIRLKRNNYLLLVDDFFVYVSHGNTEQIFGVKGGLFLQTDLLVDLLPDDRLRGTFQEVRIDPRTLVPVEIDQL